MIDCAEGRFVLEAAKAAGLRLPSSCTKGMCGTCKSKLISGKVDMQHQGGIRQREIDASIAAKAEFEYLYDKPYDDKKKVRVAGPFTVESLTRIFHPKSKKIAKSSW